MNTEGAEKVSEKEKFAQARRETALRKYEEAVALYATTDMPVRLIAKECHVPEGGLQVHLRRWHRPLMLVRYGVTLEGGKAEEVKLGSKRGQRHSTREKYRKAIEACENIDYIQFSVSLIARGFGLSEAGLGNQLRVYYPEVLEWRE